MSDIVDFQALLAIAVASLVGGCGLVGTFALVVVGLSRRWEARSEGASGASGTALVVAALLACLALLVFGLFAVTQK